MKPLSEIKAMLAGITPGPWFLDRNENGDGYIGFENKYRNSEPIISLSCGSGYAEKNNAQFIAVAPSIISDLIARVEAYREVARLTGHVCHTPECDCGKLIDQETERIIKEKELEKRK